MPLCSIEQVYNRKDCPFGSKDSTWGCGIILESKEASRVVIENLDLNGFANRSEVEDLEQANDALEEGTKDRLEAWDDSENGGKQTSDEVTVHLGLAFKLASWVMGPLTRQR